jgi:hypothetical protein
MNVIIGAMIILFFSAITWVFGSIESDRLGLYKVRSTIGKVGVVFAKILLGLLSDLVCVGLCVALYGLYLLSGSLGAYVVKIAGFKL